MTSEDDNSLNEDELEAVVDRVVERLQEETGSRETQVDAGPQEESSTDEGAAGDRRDPDEAHEVAERLREKADRLEARAENRRDRHRSRGTGLDDLGERIERSVEASLAGIADDIERAFGVEPAGTTNGVTIGPEHTGEKAVYKTQLQKAGRVAVPDAEIEALGLEPGDTLQVVLYPVD